MSTILRRTSILTSSVKISPKTNIIPRITHNRPLATMTTGNFRYLDPATLEVSKPWAKVDTDVTSFSRLERRRSVANIRDSTEEFGTDVSGFAVYNSPAKEKDFNDDEAVRSGYYAEVEALLREKLPGVKKVVIFDHTIRRREKSSPRQPVQQVHVDQTPGAAEARVRRHVPGAEADELVNGRYQIINVWRPIGHPASDFPLAVIDWRTTEPKDLIAVDLLYPRRTDTDDDDRGKEVLPDPALARSTENYDVKGKCGPGRGRVSSTFILLTSMQARLSLLHQATSTSCIMPKI